MFDDMAQHAGNRRAWLDEARSSLRRSFQGCA